ncbi:hypothetical protein LCM28_18150 [Salipiger pacificus]|nr:hypothetical protein [Alloyangia pacifica]
MLSIKEIASFFAQERRNGNSISLLMGAGCSRSSGIPTAQELLCEIRDCGRYDASISLLESDDLRDYGRVMGALDFRERRELLERHLNRSKINWAHLGMATLMHSGHIGRVLTLNFDNILARACGSCGMFPATYDFASASPETFRHLATPAIIHLHGQGHGHSILNTHEETERQAKKIRPLLIDTLETTLLLVVGYSGYSDEIFPNLVDLSGRCRRIIWVGRSERPQDHVVRLIKQAPTQVLYANGGDADVFFTDLARELECFPPKFMTDPLGHLLDIATGFCKFPVKDTTQYRIDYLNSCKQQLLRMKEQISPEELDLMATNTRLMQGRAEEADLDNTSISAEIRSAIAFEYGKNLQKEASQSNLAAFLEALKNSARLFEKAVEISPDFKEAHNNLGYIFYHIAETSGKEEDYRKAMQHYKNALAIDDQYAAAIQNLASTFVGLGLIHSGDEQEKSFCQAENLYLEALKITPERTYDLACLYSVWGNAASARPLLEKWAKLKSYPDARHARQDPDLRSIFSEKWFQDILLLRGSDE